MWREIYFRRGDNMKMKMVVKIEISEKEFDDMNTEISGIKGDQYPFVTAFFDAIGKEMGMHET